MPSYIELSDLKRQDFFIRKIEIAVAKFALSILNEGAGVPGHTARVRWAKQAIQETGSLVTNILPAVVLQEAVQLAMDNVTDEQLQTAVETVIALFAREI